jgi:hypothetical protein
MKDMVDAKNCGELWTAIKSIPFKLSKRQQELGPVVRLQ